MSVIIIPRRQQVAPQGRVMLAAGWQEAATGWMHYAPHGRHAVFGPPADLPYTRAITPSCGGLGYRYAANGGGDAITLPSFASTNTATFYFVVVLASAVQWAPTFYARNSINGPVFGADGRAFHYLWDGSEWNYSTGLTAMLGQVTAGAYTVRPDRVDIALNGKTHTRTVTNPTRAFPVPGQLRIGQDEQALSRTLDGHVLLAGIVTDASVWSLEKLRAFTSDPWQIFRADPIRIYSFPTGPIGISWSSLTASNITQTGARLTLGGIVR